MSIQQSNPATSQNQLSLTDAISSGQDLFIQQKKNWGEIILDFETANRYAIMTPDGQTSGMVAERSTGFMGAVKRLILRSHRGFYVDVVDNSGRMLFQLSRSFFFFFSDLRVTGPGGQLIGSIHRKFALINKKYELKNSYGMTFATIKSPIWRLWTFPVKSIDGTKSAEISKKWGGGLREIFTDADTFRVHFGHKKWSAPESAVLFSAAISIDFDFFEKNQGVSGVFDILNG